MESFFDKQDLQLDEMQKGKFLSCVSCGLHKYVLTPRMKPFGAFKKRIMFIGEAPGENEDRKGKPWQGKMGTLLRNTLQSLGLNLFQDGISLNSCLCRPPNNETPTDYQIDCCRRRIQKIIEEYKPHVIVLLGGVAVQSIIGKYWKKDLGGITKWSGWTIPDKNYKAWICPVFHPSYVDRGKNSDLKMKIWKDDLKRAISMIDKPFPKQPDHTKCLTYCHTLKQVKKSYRELKNWPYLSFDFETTGLRPYMKGHKIFCTSLSNGTQSHIWVSNPKTDKYLAKLLTDKTIKKTAHNIQFEDLWTDEMLGCHVQGWDWCTMNVAHILNNRRGITGLKFQTYVNFGIAGYDDEVSAYIGATDKNVKKYGANAINRLDEFIERYGIEKLMEYCGYDSLFGYWLKLKQTEDLNASSN